MGFLARIFKKTNDPLENQPFDFNKLIESDNLNNSIIEFDNYIGNLCAYGDNISKLNNHQKIFYYNQCLERELNNGGFNQFYFNSSGEFAHETIDSLKAIGAHKTADIIHKANNFFPNGEVPKQKEKRQEVLDQIADIASDTWEQLEDQFLAYEDDLNSLNMAYIRSNRDKFEPCT